MKKFAERFEEYKKIPHKCKDIQNWLEEVGDDMQHGLVLNQDEQYELSIAIRHGSLKCRKCICPEKSD